MNPIIISLVFSAIVLVIAVGISYYFYHKNEANITFKTNTISQQISKNVESKLSSFEQQIDNRKISFVPSSNDENLLVNSLTATNIFANTSGMVNAPYFVASINSGKIQGLYGTSGKNWGSMSQNSETDYVVSVKGLYMCWGNSGDTSVNVAMLLDKGDSISVGSFNGFTSGTIFCQLMTTSFLP